jgi:spore coat polysaccharide biosynthesis protein SpsF (cytidylyltransferase family)
MESKAVGVAVIDLGDFSRPGMQAAASHFAARTIGGQPLVVRMARRLSDCARVSEVYIVGSNIPSSLLTSGFAGVEAINLPSCHACERLCTVVDRSGADWIVAVPANRPFVDPTLIDQLLSRAMKMPKGDYVGYASDAGDWRRISNLGLAGEACHADTIRRLRRNADRLTSDDSGSIASWLENAPGAYHLKFVPIPDALDRADLRFAVEDEFDWDDVQLLCETISEDDAEWQQVARVVMDNQALRASMESRNS